MKGHPMYKLLVSTAIATAFFVLGAVDSQAQPRPNPRLLRSSSSLVRPFPAPRPVVPLATLNANLGAINSFAPNVYSSNMYTPYGIMQNSYYVPTNPSYYSPVNNPYSYGAYDPYNYSGYNPYYYPGNVYPNYYSGYSPYLYSSYIPTYIPSGY